MEAVIEGKGLVKLYRSLQAADGIDPIVRAGEGLPSSDRPARARPPPWR
jgi:glucokinase